MIPKEVLSMFDLSGEIVPLKGGQENSYRVGDFIIKRNDGDNLNYEYLVEMIITLDNPYYRISKPVKNKQGTHVYKGYIVFEYQEGEHDFTRVEENLKISYMLRNDLKQFDIDRFHMADNQWSLAMDILFRNRRIPKFVNEKHMNCCIGLLNQVKTYKGDLQIIHSDLGGNILFHSSLPPCIIDFSPNVAPPKMQEAIIVADDIAWGNKNDSAIYLLDDYRLYIPYLKYAVLFRLLSAACKTTITDKEFESEYNQYIHVWELCDKLETF